MKLARIGEPLSVNGLDSVKTIPTMPNTITIAFHEKDPISDTQARLVTAQNAIDNANQSQYILNQMGRWVAYAPSSVTPTGN